MIKQEFDRLKKENNELKLSLNLMTDKPNDENSAVAEKYSWFQNHAEELSFTVVHKGSLTITIIALTDTAEKAHFLATAANQYKEPQTPSSPEALACLSLNDVKSCCGDDSSGGGCLYLDEEKLKQIVRERS
jgi:hypothetical protein